MSACTNSGDHQDRDYDDGPPTVSPAANISTAAVQQTKTPEGLVVSGTGVTVITLAGIETHHGHDHTTKKAIDDYEVPNGFEKEGGHGDSLMHSLGVSTKNGKTYTHVIVTRSNRFIRPIFKLNAHWQLDII